MPAVSQSHPQPLSQHSDSQRNVRGSQLEQKPPTRKKPRLSEPENMDRQPNVVVAISDASSGPKSGVQWTDEDEDADLLSGPIPGFEGLEPMSAQQLYRSESFAASWQPVSPEEQVQSSQINGLCIKQADREESRLLDDVSPLKIDHEDGDIKYVYQREDCNKNKDVIKSEEAEEEIDLNVERFRGHLAAFASTSTSFTKVTRPLLSAKSKTAPTGCSDSKVLPTNGAKVSPKKSASKPRTKRKAIPTKEETKSSVALAKDESSDVPSESKEAAGPKQAVGVSKSESNDVPIEDKKSASPRKPKQPRKPRKPKSANDSEDQKMPPPAKPRDGSTSPRKMDRKSPSKKETLPDPVDITGVPTSSFLVLKICPLCAESFKKSHSGPIRRRHVGVCAAIQNIAADLIIALVKDELSRLDKVERLERGREEESRTAFDLVMESSGLRVCLVKAGDRASSKPKTITNKAARAAESSNVSRRRLAGLQGSLLINPSEARRIAVEKMRGFKPSTSVLDQFVPSGIDCNTGNVTSDMSEPIYSFPSDQRMAERKFLSTVIDFDASTQYFPPATQTFTQTPSETLITRSSSRLCRRRKPVVGAGTGLSATPFFGPLS
ncbi:unnamed protein product [Sympodiomycopsis kandeliae]